MRRFAKLFAGIIGTLIALFAVVAIAISLFFDPNDFREEIAAAVLEATGRDLVIDGEVDLQLFPWLAVEVGHATLGNADGFGDEAFAEFERAELSVQVLPLVLRQEIAIGTAALDGLRLNLAVQSNGQTNWGDLASASGDGEEADAATEESSSQHFEVSGVEFNDASIAYADDASGSAYSLNDVNMKFGRIATVRGVITLDGFELDGVMAGLTSSPTSFSIRTAGIAIDPTAETVQLDPIEMRALDVEITADVESFSYVGDFKAMAAIEIAEFSPRDLMQLFDVPPLRTADPSVLSVFAMQATAELHESYAVLSDVTITLDDTTFTGGVTVPFDMTERQLLDVRADAIDLNRYMEPATEGSTTATGEAAPVEIPVDLIRPLNARGSFKIESVLLGGLELEQLDVNLETRNGRMRLHPMSANLFGGAYLGDVSIDVAGSVPVLSMNESIEGVDLGKLAMAMYEQDNISGTMSGNFKLSGRGQDMAGVQRTLNGTMAFELQDGTFEGTDIWYELRRARALLKQEAPPEPVLPARTRFTKFVATGVVTDGVMHNNDLIAELPFMQLTGRGDVDLPAATVDYNLRARVFENPEALEEATPEELADFTKLVIPLTITGPIASPKVRPDIEELLRERVEEEVKEKLQDALKDLFR